MTGSTPEHFRAARERAGLSVAEVAVRAGVAEPCIWDVESYEDELTSVYSPAQLRRFAAVLGVRPVDLLGVEPVADPVSHVDLAAMIRGHCQVRGITIDEFGDAAGWEVKEAVDAPERLLHEVSIDGIRDICRELGIDWQRFIGA
jgi:transcriptional regulator with XRE-family HTH domain